MLYVSATVASACGPSSLPPHSGSEVVTAVDLSSIDAIDLRDPGITW